jgi:hypothetical protein
VYVRGFMSQKYDSAYYQKHREKHIERSKKWYRDNLEKAKAIAKKHGQDPTKLERRIFLRTRLRAKKNGTPFNLDITDIIIPKVCPILGIELIPNIGRGHTDNSPSLDRVINDLGYIKGNVQIISYKANAMKRNASMEDLIRLGEWAKSTKFTSRIGF